MRLYFESAGQGPPLIVLHGLFGSLENWRSTTRRLSENFSVFAVDQRNHGRSLHSDEMNYAVMAEDLRDFMQGQNLKAAHILGHSMGGKTAMQFALQYPDKVDHLVVADIAPRQYAPGHKSIIVALRAIDPSKFATRKEIEAALAAEIPDLAVRQFLLKDLKRTPNGAFAWQMNLSALSKNYDLLNEALDSNRPADVPALFLKGEKSDYIRDKDEEMIHRLFPRAIIKTLEGAGHRLHVEAPEAFIRTVKDFLLPAKTSG
jgi:pimeloyl-ACP methyl ester carboxylesterase